MKILLFSQHYPPDIGAQATRMQALVKAVLDGGHEVTIITGEPNRYNIKGKNNFKRFEKHFNLEIYRIKTGKHKDIFWRRPLNYISFMINSLICSFRLKQKRYDMVIVTSPPITGAATAFLYCFFKHTNLVFEVRDLWPDTLVDLKVFRNKLVINFLKYIEKVLYRKAKLIVVVSEAFKIKIIDKGISEDKIVTFSNGLDKEFVLENVTIERKNAIREEYNIPKDKTIVSYVGNVGISQNLEIIIGTAKKIEDDNILFLVVGEGLEKRRLLRLVKEKHLDNKILFLNALPRDKIKNIYQLSDILFLQLKDLIIFKSTIPSKIFEYLSSGLPIIYGLNGIAADILKKSGNGIKIKPECDDDLVGAVKTIKDKYDFYVGRAKKGRDFVIKNYMREAIMKNYVDTLEKRFLLKQE
jgi:glycosyltransferase involved in cell wall biosynthesis